MKEEKVNIEKLKELSKSISNKKDTILEINDNNLHQLLTESRTLIKTNELKLDSIEESIKYNIKELEKNLNSLIEILNNTIIPMYEESKYEIKNLFNNKLAKDVNNLLEIGGNKNE